MDKNTQYEKIDKMIYENQILPYLPEAVVDFHVHLWTSDQFRKKSEKDQSSLDTDDRHTRYMVTTTSYRAEQLLEDVSLIFPKTGYEAVVFGHPTPQVDTDQTNAYVFDSTKKQSTWYALAVAGGKRVPLDVLSTLLHRQDIYGVKVFLPWIGDDYQNIGIEDMLDPMEMALLNETNAVVMLHVPRSARLADRQIQKGVERFAKNAPNAGIVLAHCGRCYHPDEMKKAIDSIKHLGNVYMDTSMVMDPLVLQMVINTIGPQRMLFATDFPVAAMRGRRVYVADHWVDVVVDEYPASAYRVSSNDIRATYMAYEIILAILRAAEQSGIEPLQTKAIFYDNAKRLLQKASDHIVESRSSV